MRNPPLPTDDWRLRWLVLPTHKALHHISSIEVKWGSLVKGHPGKAVCGARGMFHEPGCVSAVFLPRCSRCCKALGIPEGEGRHGEMEGWGEQG